MSKRTKDLLKTNNELEKQLSESEQKILTDISAYIRHANISPYYQESIRCDIITMIIDGTKKGLTVDEIIGEDYQSFCDNVLRELPELSGKDRAFSLVRDALPSVMVLLSIWFIFSLIDVLIGSGDLPYIPITLGDGLGFILILFAAFFIFAFISKNAFLENKSVNFKLYLMIFVVIFLSGCASIFLKQTLFQLHALIILAVIFVLFICYQILEQKID